MVEKVWKVGDECWAWGDANPLSWTVKQVINQSVVVFCGVNREELMLSGDIHESRESCILAHVEELQAEVDKWGSEISGEWAKLRYIRRGNYFLELEPFNDLVRWKVTNTTKSVMKPDQEGEAPTIHAAMLACHQAWLELTKAEADNG